VWRYAGSLDVRCVRTCVCNPAAVKAAEELHARSKGYLTSVTGTQGYPSKQLQIQIVLGLSVSSINPDLLPTQTSLQSPKPLLLLRIFITTPPLRQRQSENIAMPPIPKAPLTVPLGAWAMRGRCVCVYYCSTYYKAVRVGGGGQWRTCATIRETTSRGLCGLVCPSRTSEREGEGDCVKEGRGGEGERERERALGLLLCHIPRH
jgi:hypothetical protein